MSNIDLGALSHFLAAARHENLQIAASDAHVTASALSRSIKKLESQLQTTLFDRVGRQLRLNHDGMRLREQGMALLAQAEHTVAQFKGAPESSVVRVLGPALLHWQYLPNLMEKLQHGNQVSVHSDVCFEDEALTRLRAGEGDLALVSDVAFRHDEAEFARVSLGKTRMVLCCAHNHPLASMPVVTEAHLKMADFACPRHSLFCGLERGKGSDGWRSDVYPRHIKYWADDLAVLLRWVQSALAIAYLPEYVQEHAGLKRLNLEQCPFVCEEQIWLVFRRSTLTGWQLRLLDSTPSIS